MIDIDVTYEGGYEPEYAHQGDAAVDLRADDYVTLNAGDRAMVSTGVKVAIPDGYVGLVCSRSGLALRSGLIVLNAPGVVDSGYRGDIGVILINLGNQTVDIDKGDRIAQLMFMPYAHASFYPMTMPTSERGVGGFGSTGRA